MKNQWKPVLLVGGLLIVLLTLGACSGGSAETTRPTEVRTTAPHTLTPALSPTFTATATPSLTPTAQPTNTPTITPTPGCGLTDAEGKLYVLADDVLDYIGPDAEELDRALNALFPQWASFRQTVPWWDEPISAGQVVEDASFDETFEINPAVTLVTVGMQLDWQPPADGDLFSRAQSVSEQLHGLFWKYARWKHLGEHKDEEAQARFQDVANAATYALYAFFHFDRAALKEWCEMYQALYGRSPLIVP